jgi:uncharacterized membrane protein
MTDEHVISQNGWARQIVRAIMRATDRMTERYRRHYSPPMSEPHVLVLALLIGVADGLRSMTPPAVVGWAAHRQWIALRDTPLAFMASLAAVVVTTVLALVELVGDKLPSTPSRTAGPGLLSRIALGGLSGAVVAVAGGQSLAIGGVLGAVGGIIGAFGGYQARTRLVRALEVPDIVVALCEDALAIGGSFLIVWRLR